MATNDRDALIDSGAGISLEEQREILAQIDGIAEKNRQALSSGAKGARKIAAKKSGAFFPAMVNILAIVALGAGLFALYRFQDAADASAREGARVFNEVERALIEELRAETGALLAGKDREIAQILASLSEVETQLDELAAISGALTGAQNVRQERLLSEREAYRLQLEGAREERATMLESARLREAVLQAQMEARARDFALASERGAIELDAARAELAALSRDQERAAVVEAQISGMIALAHAQIAEGDFDGAESAIAALQDFLDGPALQALRGMQARREIHAQAVSALRLLLARAREDRASLLAAGYGELSARASAELGSMQDRIAGLQADLDQARDALVAGDLDAARVVSQYRSEIGQLESSLAALQSQNAALNAQNSTLNNQNTALNSQNSALSSQNTALGAQVSALQGNLSAQTQAAESLGQNVRALESTNALLNQTIGARDGEISVLRGENQTLGAQLAQAQQQIQQIQQALQALLQE
ncbi:MAG: hypothetical protein FWE09_02275 [Treponema sp.]|nr:hypothetical protein [Treponema sp.]